MSVLFWSVFSHIRTEYGEILRILLYTVQMQENTDQNNSEYRNILRSGRYSFAQCMNQVRSHCKSKNIYSNILLCNMQKKMGSSLAKISIKDIILNHQISWKNKKVQRLYEHVFDEVSLFRNQIKRIEMWYKELCWTKIIKYKSSRQVHVFFLKFWRFALTKRASSEIMKIFTSKWYKYV